MIRAIQFIFAAFILLSVQAQEPTRWRGPSGNGIYGETGLLKAWPESGPEILWTCEQLGQGHSSAAADDGFIYTTGMIDGTGYLFKFDGNGKVIYKKPYGPEYTQSWYGTRGTPVIAGDRIYLVSGNGNLVCFNKSDGNIRWEKNLFKAFDGKNIQWGFNETPVIDGDVIYVTPGGRENNMVALNRHTGALIWSSPGEGDLSAYCTPLLFEHNGRKILATHTADHLIGVDAITGKLLWSRSITNEWSVHPNTPLYNDGTLFCFSGYGRGGLMLKLSPDGSSVSEVWKNRQVDTRLGGAVLVNGYLYLCGDNNREWRCLDWLTGKEMYAATDITKGAVIYADGMLYCYSERGELALVKADPSGFQVVSKTMVTRGSEQHWAHPMIHDGVLYVRHGQALIAYRVKNGKSGK